jgi:hypothetical protein
MLQAGAEVQCSDDPQGDDGGDGQPGASQRGRDDQSGSIMAEMAVTGDKYSQSAGRGHAAGG